MRLLDISFVSVLSLLIISNAEGYVRRGRNSTASQQSETSSVSFNNLQQYVSLKFIDAPKTRYKETSEYDNIDLNFSNYVGMAIAYGLKYAAFSAEIEAKATTSADYQIRELPFYAHYSTNFKTLMLNMYYNIGIWDGFYTFVNGGIGGEQVTAKLEVTSHLYNINEKGNENGFAYQVGFGFGYKISDNIRFDTGYRYVSAPNIDDGITLSNHELSVSAQYYF